MQILCIRTLLQIYFVSDFFSSGKIWWYFGSSADLSFLRFFSWLIFGIWIDRIAYFEQKPLIFSGVPQHKNPIKRFFMASLYFTKRSVCIQLGMQIRHLESCSNKFNFYFLLTSVRDALVCLIVTRLLFVIVAHIEMASPGT